VAGVSDDAVDPEFELPNVGPGADPFSPAAADADFVVVVLQRDYYCGGCRQQVRALAQRYDAFRERGAEVVSVLPEPRERAAEWQARYDLPFPLVADADAAVGAAYDQPVRFGLLGRLHDVIGRMPTAAILDRRGEGAELAFVYRGSTTADRPTVDDLLAELDRLRGSPVVEGGRDEREVDGGGGATGGDESDGADPDRMEP